MGAVGSMGRKKRSKLDLNPYLAALRHAFQPLEPRLLLSTLFWSPGGTTGGSGQWDLSSQNWTTAANGGGTREAWVQGSTPTFGNASGTVTLASAISASGVTFNTSGYVLSGTMPLSLQTSSVTVATGTATINSVITGTVGLAKAGTGTLTLAGVNTFTGNTTLSAGQLNINNAHAISSGALIINGGAIDNTSGAPITLSTNNVQTWGGNFTYVGTGSLNLGTGAVAMSASRAVTISASTLTIGGVISGSAFSLTKAGAGTLTLAGTNLYTGGTTLSAGQLNINNAKAIGTGTFTVSGGTIDNTSGSAITLGNNNVESWSGNFTFAGSNDLNMGTGAVTLSASRTVTVTSHNLSIGGVISGTGFSLTKAARGR